MVYCRSDAAYLCLSCDRSVHSANALSKRHLRTLVCEQCNCQIATVRCLEENLSLCQNCNRSGHGTPASPADHKSQTIDSYSGCPSAAELSRIWSFFYVDQLKSDPAVAAIILVEGDKTKSLPPCLLPLIESRSELTDETATDSVDSDAEPFDGLDSLNTSDQQVISYLGLSS